MIPKRKYLKTTTIKCAWGILGLQHKKVEQQKKGNDNEGNDHTITKPKSSEMKTIFHRQMIGIVGHVPKKSLLENYYKPNLEYASKWKELLIKSREFPQRFHS